MILTMKFIEENSYVDVVNTHILDLNDKAEYYKNLQRKEDEKYEAKLADFEEMCARNKYLSVDPANMTDDEKNELIAKAYQMRLTEELNISKFSDARLKKLQDKVIGRIKPFKPINYNTQIEEIRSKENLIFIKGSKSDILNDETRTALENFALKALSKGKQIRIAINDPMIEMDNNSDANYLYSVEDMAKISNLNNKLAEAGMEKQFVFDEFNHVETEEDFDKAWNIDEVVKANAEITKIVETIREKELSPFEAMLYIHNYITRHYQYNESKSQETSRVIVGAVNKNEIVCSGYASFVKAVVDKLNIPELKCEIVGCEIYKKNLTYKLEGGHCHNLIKISDPKYDINGVYAEDACWDAKNEEYPNGKGYAYCLYPISDLEHFKAMHYVQRNKNNRYDSLILDSKEYEDAMLENSRIIRENSNINNMSKMDKLKLKFDLLKRQVDRYKERKEKIKDGADIVKKYSDQSAPISIETYKEGLYNLFESVLGTVPEKYLNKLNDYMLNSMKFACADFDKNACTGFASDRKTVKGYISNISTGFAAKDGRNV